MNIFLKVISNEIEKMNRQYNDILRLDIQGKTVTISCNITEKAKEMFGSENIQNASQTLFSMKIDSFMDDKQIAMGLAVDIRTYLEKEMQSSVIKLTDNDVVLTFTGNNTVVLYSIDGGFIHKKGQKE